MNGFTLINQARMTSTRLPGKVLKEVLEKPLLEYQLERLQKSKRVNKIVIATTVNQEDEAIVKLCKKLDVSYFRGSELDVLARYYLASVKFPSNYVIRVTSDCPLHDPMILDRCIDEFLASKADYYSNSNVYPNGMNVEIFSSDMLKEAFEKGTLPYEREHVTPYFYTHPEIFKIAQAAAIKNYPSYRLTVDTPEDFQLIRTLLERLYPKNPNFTLDDICLEFTKDPQLEKINAHIRQKKFDEI